MVRRRSNPRAILWTTIVACLVVALACCVGLVLHARLAEERWAEVVAHFDSRLPEVEYRFTGGWSPLDAQIEALTASTALESGGSGPGSVKRIIYRSVPRTISTPPAHSTPRDRAWWRGLLSSSRERKYRLHLGDGHNDIVVTIRQERQWLVTDLRVDIRSKTPLDSSRSTVLADAVAEVGLQPW